MATMTAAKLASPCCGSAQVAKLRAGNLRPSVAPAGLASARYGVAGCSSWQMRATFLQPKRREVRFLHAACIAAPEAPEAELEVVDGKEVPETVPETLSPLTPSPGEIQSLLMEVCDETSIAEISLKVGAFKLHVKRAIKAKEAPAPPPAPAVAEQPAAPTPAAAAPTPAVKQQSVTETSLTKPGSILQVLEQAVNEGLSFVQSPKVGYFRRGRVVKGKLGKPIVEEGQVVKEGQVVCYLEQLGTQQPVETDISGEVVKILWNDEDPVGYGDPLIAIRPAFPGIKKLAN